MCCFVLFHKSHNFFVDPCCVEAEEVVKPTCVLIAMKMSVVVMVVVVMIQMMHLRTDHQWHHLLLWHHLLILVMLKVVSVVPFQTEAKVQLLIYHKEVQDIEFYNENSVLSANSEIVLVVMKVNNRFNKRI